VASLTPWLLDSRGNSPWWPLNRNINGPHSQSGGCEKAENLPLPKPLPPDSGSGDGDYDNDDKAMNRNSTSLQLLLPPYNNYGTQLPHLFHTVPMPWGCWHLHLLMSHGSPSACDANETSWTHVQSICYTLSKASKSVSYSKWYWSPQTSPPNQTHTNLSSVSESAFIQRLQVSPARFVLPIFLFSFFDFFKPDSLTSTENILKGVNLFFWKGLPFLFFHFLIWKNKMSPSFRMNLG